MADPVKPNTDMPLGSQSSTSSEEVAKRQNEKNTRTVESARDSAARKLDEENAARHEANVEAERRRSESKPTPTQRENDLAKLGLLDHDEKEDDGSGPEVLQGLRRDASPEDAAKYKTREMSKK